MTELSIEKRIEKYDALPERLRQELNSDESANMVWIIGEAHHFSENRTRKLLKVVSYIILGSIHPEDLPKEIVSEAGVDKRLADEVAREIQLKILNPVIPEIQKLYNYGLEVTPPPQSTAIKPAFAKESQPFILHEEQEETKSVRPTDETLVRPSFYEETRLRQDYGGQVRTEPPMAARLEIGQASSGQMARREPQVGKTEESPIRVVHYSGPQTPVDPFGDQRPDISNQSLEARGQKTEPPKEVHPENIVDLKDLPK